MIIVSYDIKNDKLRTKFAKMLTKNGAIRLQLSVYEINNTKRIIENIKLKIEKSFADKFCPDDSVVILNIKNEEIIKYGNAIHRDNDVVFF